MIAEKRQEVAAAVESLRSHAADEETGRLLGAIVGPVSFLLRFPLSAGTLGSFQAAVEFTLGAHRRLVTSSLDRPGASYRYAANALTLNFIALYLTRFNQISAIEKVQPQLLAVATTFDPGRSARAVLH